MILTRDVIRREIAAGRVVIDPFVDDQVGPASIDLHLGDEIRVMHPGPAPVPVARLRALVLNRLPPSPEDLLIRIQVVNRGPEMAAIDLLPTIWFRNTWA